MLVEGQVRMHAGAHFDRRRQLTLRRTVLTNFTVTHIEKSLVQCLLVDHHHLRAREACAQRRPAVLCLAACC